MRVLVLCLALFTSSSLLAQKNTPSKQIREFENYVAKVMKEWDVPGLSIVVVKNGKTIISKGYGVREIDKPGAVDAQTLFSCASTTKAMSAMVLGMLVDEGKLSWDDHVTKYIPELRLYDPYVTRELRVRDLLIHNSGLGSTDYFWSMMDIRIDEVLRRLVYVKPVYSFRAGYEYQNTMYTLAGVVTERISGKKWTEVMTQKLFTPLGMSQTVPSRTISKSENMTRPHYPVKGEKRVLHYLEDREIGSAGGVWSNANEMSKWIRFLLDSGKVNGTRLVRKETFLEMFRPQTLFPANEYPTLSILKPNWLTYGLGWFQHDYKGRKINFHTGSLPGLTAIIGLIPEENFGIYIFGNYDHAEVRHALMYKSFDWFLFGGSRDWNAEFRELYGGIKKVAEEAREEYESNRIANTKPTLPLSSYSGTYYSQVYGKIVVSEQGNNLLFDINDHFLSTTLPHWHYDTFHGQIGEAGQYDLTATFGIDAAGKVTSLDLDGMDFEREIDEINKAKL